MLTEPVSGGLDRVYARIQTVGSIPVIISLLLVNGSAVPFAKITANEEENYNLRSILVQNSTGEGTKYFFGSMCKDVTAKCQQKLFFSVYHSITYCHRNGTTRGETAA
jgi:hypothetical protein